MEFFLFIFIVVNLLIIAYQDLKVFAVSWIVFPLLAAAFFISGNLQIGLRELLFNTLINTMLIVCQLLLISIYFSLKEKKLALIINSKIGLGDVLVFFALSIAFSPLNYVLFISVSLILSLIITLVRKMKKNSIEKIPLAGYMSIYFMLFLIFQLVYGFDPYGFEFISFFSY